MLKFFRLSRNGMVFVALSIAIMAGGLRTEKTGDYLQVALPVAALACSIVNGEALSYALRFAAVEIVLKSSKFGLGTAPINIRPNGGAQGFPSGHTTAAAFGASSLVHTCVTGNPWVKGIVVLSGGFVGASRIEAGAHFLFQVLAGALLGWIGERSLALVRVIRLLLRQSKRILRQSRSTQA